jgi:hypothetical protein
LRLYARTVPHFGVTYEHLLPFLVKEASALGGSLTCVASGDELLCRREAAGRFAVGIEAYWFCTQLVVLLAVPARGGCAGSGSIRTRPSASAAGFLFAQDFLATVAQPHVPPVHRVVGACSDSSVRLREMSIVVAQWSPNGRLYSA